MSMHERYFGSPVPDTDGISLIDIYKEVESYSYRFHCTFSSPITQAQFESFVASVAYFNYHPAGYGGGVARAPGWRSNIRRTDWTWYCGTTAD